MSSASLCPEQAPLKWEPMSAFTTEPQTPDPEESVERKTAVLLIALGSVSFTALIALIAAILAIAN